VLAILDKGQQSELPRPVLITADVPIGLPKEYPEVWEKYGGFLEWLDARRDDGFWESIIVDSVAQQTEQSPFAVCKKGEKKRDGKFPNGNARRSLGVRAFFSALAESKLVKQHCSSGAMCFFH
jgi:hypothetical protein